MIVLSQLEPDIIKEIREDLLRHLTEVLGGDRLAAEFMLLHLLSKVNVTRSQIIIVILPI